MAKENNQADSNFTTWKLARMNLAIRVSDAEFSTNSHDEYFDTLRRLLPQ